MEYRMVEIRQNEDGTEQPRLIDFSDLQKRLNDFLLNQAKRLSVCWEWVQTDSLSRRHRQFYLVLLKENAVKYKKYVAFLLDEERQSVRFLVWDIGKFLKINSGQDKNLFRRETFMGESLPNYLVHKNQSLDKEEYSYVCDALNPAGHHMLGRPCFTQYDPREEKSLYDTLLLQIDTEMDGLTDYILWGDCGVGSFFINREALLARRFDDVLYSWDCC